MNATNLKELIESAVTISPDRRHSLAWSWGGTIGIFELKYGEPLLSFREEHGAILRAGFSPDMRQLIAENEDRSFSVWYTVNEIGGRKCFDTGNIVDFMTSNLKVPCLNVLTGLKACRFNLTLQDFSDAQYDYYNWGRDYCVSCAWYKRMRVPSARFSLGPQCTCRGGCEFKHKLPR